MKYAADSIEGRTEFVTAGRVDVALPAGIATGTGAQVLVNDAPVVSLPSDRTISFAVPAGTARWRVEKR